MQHHTIIVGKREFIQHTSKYLKLAETKGKELIITHQGKPVLHMEPMKKKTINDLKGLITRIHVKGDINEPIVPGFEEW